MEALATQGHTGIDTGGQHSGAESGGQQRFPRILCHRADDARASDGEFAGKSHGLFEIYDGLAAAALQRAITVQRRIRHGHGSIFATQYYGVALIGGLLCREQLCAPAIILPTRRPPDDLGVEVRLWE